MSEDPRSNIPPQVADALAKGNLIQAIKYMREQQPSLGLAEAKALIEAIQRQQQGGAKVNVRAAVKTVAKAAVPTNIPSHSTPHTPSHAAPTASMDPHVSPGEMPRTSGSAGFAMLVVAIAVVVAAAIYFGR